MAILPDADRRALWAQLMADLSEQRAALPLTKGDLRAAVDATDEWINSSAVSYNNALPQPARGALTARQKLALFLYVARRRWEVG